MDQQAKDAEAYHDGRDAYRHDPKGRSEAVNPYHSNSSMWDHFERGFRDEAEKQVR